MAPCGPPLDPATDNTRCHLIGHKITITRIKFRVDSQGKWVRAYVYGGNAIMKMCFELGKGYCILG